MLLLNENIIVNVQMNTIATDILAIIARCTCAHQHYSANLIIATAQNYRVWLR